MPIRYNDHFTPTDEDRACSTALYSHEIVQFIISAISNSNLLRNEDLVKEYKDSTLSIECKDKRTAMEKQKLLTSSLIHDFELTDPADVKDAQNVFHVRNNRIYTSIALLGKVLGIEDDTNLAVATFHHAQNLPLDYALNTASFTEYHNPENARDALEALLRSKCEVIASSQTSDQVATITGSHRLIHGYQKIVMSRLGVMGYETRSSINPGYSRLIVNAEQINDALQREHDRKYNTTPTPHSSQDSISTQILSTPEELPELSRRSTRFTRSRSDQSSELRSPVITSHKRRKTEEAIKSLTR